MNEERSMNVPLVSIQNENSGQSSPAPCPPGTYSALLAEAREEWESLSKSLKNFRRDRYTSCSKGYVAVAKLPFDITADLTTNTKDLIAISAQIIKAGHSYRLITEASVSYTAPNGKTCEEDVSLNLPVSDYDPVFEPAFDYLMNKDIEVYMVGRVAVPFDYVIIDMYLKPVYFSRGPAYTETNPDQPIFKLALDYLLTGPTEKIEKFFFEHEFTTVSEYSLVSEFFPAYYPEGINKAIQRNLQIATSVATTSEEQKQAKVALHIITNVDWRTKPLDIPELNLIREKLDAELYGLEQVKEQLLEAMAMIKKNTKMPKWGILLQGPPGTGKTAIATFVSKLFGCPATQIDINSLADQMTLTGSPRLYENGSVGLLIAKIFSVRSATQIMVLNELDKGNDCGCSDTLLTFTDCYGFQDAFLEDEIPTENIFFIATCNSTEQVSKPLLDRFIVIKIPPYSIEDKKVIFERFTLPRALREQGLDENTVTVNKNAFSTMFERYFQEPGVRELERFALRLIGRYCLMNTTAPKEYSESEIIALLGNSSIPQRIIPQRPGLVWTAIKFNGITQLIPIEASAKDGTGKFEPVGISSRLVEDYCRSAYKYLQYTAAVDFSGVDIVVSIPQTVPDLVCNSVGMGVAAAILSAITGTTAFINAAFIGGCDLHGNTYIDDSDIASYMGVLYEKGLKTVYVPYGSHVTIERARFDGLKLIEAVNMKVLLSYAEDTAREPQ